MSAKDVYHEVVKQALTDEGWSITADPLRIEFLGVELRIDLGGERVIAADRQGGENRCRNQKLSTLVSDYRFS